jgi:hypothetical protein
MALRQSHNLKGGVNVPASHWVIESFQFHRFAENISVTMIGWSDAARRAQWKVAKARVPALRATLRNAQGADPSGPDYDQDIADALTALADNQLVIEANDELRQKRTALVPADINPSGNVILAKIYTAIKLLPDWTGASNE